MNPWWKPVLERWPDLPWRVPDFEPITRFAGVGEGLVVALPERLEWRSGLVVWPHTSWATGVREVVFEGRVTVTAPTEPRKAFIQASAASHDPCEVVERLLKGWAPWVPPWTRESLYAAQRQAFADNAPHPLGDPKGLIGLFE